MDSSVNAMLHAVRLVSGSPTSTGLIGSDRS